MRRGHRDAASCLHYRSLWISPEPGYRIKHALLAMLHVLFQQLAGQGSVTARKSGDDLAMLMIRSLHLGH
jgi:hypothetical protein